MTDKLLEDAEQLAKKCWGYDGYCDGPNQDERRPWMKETIEDTRELVPIIHAALQKARDEALEGAAINALKKNFGFYGKANADAIRALKGGAK